MKYGKTTFKFSHHRLFQWIPMTETKSGSMKMFCLRFYIFVYKPHLSKLYRPNSVCLSMDTFFSKLALSDHRTYRYRQAFFVLVPLLGLYGFYLWIFYMSAKTDYHYFALSFLEALLISSSTPDFKLWHHLFHASTLHL